MAAPTHIDQLWIKFTGDRRYLNMTQSGIRQRKEWYRDALLAVNAAFGRHDIHTDRERKDET